MPLSLAIFAPLLLFGMDYTLYGSGAFPVPSISVIVSTSLLYLILIARGISRLRISYSLLLAFIIWSCVSLASPIMRNSMNAGSVMKTFLHLVLYINWLVLLICSSEYLSLRALSYLSKIGILLSVIFSLIQLANGPGESWLLNSTRLYELARIPRAHGIFVEPQVAVESVLFLCICIATIEGHISRSIALLATLSVLLAQSVSGIAFIMAIALTFFVSRRLSIKSILFLGLLLAVAMASAALVRERLQLLMQGSDSGGGIVRVMTALRGLEIFIEHPMLGVGLGQIKDNAMLDGIPFVSANSGVDVGLLQLLAEGGIVGTLSLLALLKACIYQGRTKVVRGLSGIAVNRPVVFAYLFGHLVVSGLLAEPRATIALFLLSRRQPLGAATQNTAGVHL